MIAIWGSMLGAGLVLAISPWLWPRTEAKPGEGTRRIGSRLLAAAGVPDARESTLLLLAGGGAVLAASAAWLITGVAILTAVAGAAACVAPWWWLRARAARARRVRRALWPDVCDLLVASLRAGMSLPDAVAALADSAPADLRPAFAAFRDALTASGHFDTSIQVLRDRLADPVADRVVETLRMARQVGGTELPAVLRSLSASVRADAALRAEVDARQSWTRGAATLGVCAPWVVMILLSLRPEGEQAYASAQGVALVVVGAIVSVVAFRLMLRMGRLPEPRRWIR